MKRTITLLSLFVLFFVLACGSSDESQAKNEDMGKKENSETAQAASQKYAKPEAFPEKTVTSFKDVLSDKSDLTPDKIKNVGVAFVELAEFGKKNPDVEPGSEKGKEVMTEITSKYGFDSGEDLQMVMRKVYGGVSAIKMMSGLEKTDKPGELVVDMVKSMLQQTKMSRQDLDVIYENWDDGVKSIELIEKLN